MRTAIYAGSFDPFTLGHEEVVFQGLRMFDKLIIAVGVNPGKKSYFGFGARMTMIEERMYTLFPSTFESLIEVIAFENEFLVDVAERHDAGFMLRGIRNAQDFAYELEIKNFNDSRNPKIQTVFVAPPPHLVSTSSSIVRGIVGLHGWEQEIEKYASPNVIRELKEKLAQPS